MCNHYGGESWGWQYFLEFFEFKVDNLARMAKVKFSNTGDEVEVSEGTELASVTKDNGWPIAYGCENGLCGTCLIHVKEGKENLSEVDETENQTLEMMCMNDGEHRLCCRCKVNGDTEIEGL